MAIILNKDSDAAPLKPPALSYSISVSTADLWEEVPDELTQRCTAMEIYGDTDTGRSTLALTAPGPIAYLHAHEKVDGLVQRVKKSGRQIKVHRFGGSFRGSPSDVQAQCTVNISRFEAAYFHAYTWARSIIIDTHNELWSIYQLARLGSLSHAQRSEKDQRKGQLIYAEINNSFLSMLKEYRVRAGDPLSDRHVNLILVGQIEDEYKNHEKTGKKVPVGQKKLGYFCDVRLSALYDKRKNEFSAEVVKPWYNQDMRGFVAKGGVLKFSEIMSLITETDAEEWER